MNSNQRKSSYTLKTASKIFFSSKLNLRRCVVENLWEETELIDYQTNVERAQNYINKWVANVTEGEITDAIDSLSPVSTSTLVST